LNRATFAPSYELAYLVGAYISDGYLAETNPGHKVLRLAVTDREFAAAFGAVLARLLGRAPIPIQSYQRENQWTGEEYTYFVVAAGREELTRYLESGSYREAVLQYPYGFLSGFLDGDGSVSYSTSKGRRYWRFIFNFDPADGETWSLVKSLLPSDFHIYEHLKQSAIGPGREMVIYRKGEVRFLAERLNCAIPRKEERLELIRHQ